MNIQLTKTKNFRGMDLIENRHAKVMQCVDIVPAKVLVGGMFKLINCLTGETVGEFIETYDFHAMFDCNFENGELYTIYQGYKYKVEMNHNSVYCFAI